MAAITANKRKATDLRIFARAYFASKRTAFHSVVSSRMTRTLFHRIATLGLTAAIHAHSWKTKLTTSQQMALSFGCPVAIRTYRRPGAHRMFAKDTASLTAWASGTRSLSVHWRWLVNLMNRRRSLRRVSKTVSIQTNRNRLIVWLKQLIRAKKILRSPEGAVQQWSRLF